MGLNMKKTNKIIYKIEEVYVNKDEEKRKKTLEKIILDMINSSAPQMSNTHILSRR